MKIAWFTPFSTRSAIGRYSRLVTQELACLHEVEIWTFCNDDLLPSELPVHSVRSHEDVPVNTGDVAVYQMGNYWPFHGEIWRTSLQRPGVVVLHDYVMHGFFASYFFEELRDPEAYCRAMRKCHGAEGAKVAAESVARTRKPVWEGDEVHRYPMLSGVTEGALGVVAHSRFVMDAVEAHYFGPKAVLNLPYEHSAAAPAITRDDLGIKPDQWLVLTVGHANANKRIELAIDAVASLPDRVRRRVVYVIAGPTEAHYGSALRQLAKEKGVDLRLEGYTASEKMAALIAHADVCVNLRYPNTEGASASLVEQLLAGKAVITNDTGWFAELPGDVTTRARNSADLTLALTDLLDNPSRRSELGDRASRYAHETFRADIYASSLAEFLNSALSLTAVNEFADSMAAYINVMGVRVSDPWVQSVTNRAATLFGASEPAKL